MKLHHLFVLSLFGAFSLLGHAENNTHPLVPGAGVDSSIGRLPSALWPPFVETTREIEALTTDEQSIKAGTRAVLLRVESDRLVVDFGRLGVRRIDAFSTDFIDRVYDFLIGDSEKEFPNFALQVGNKMMTFGKGEKSGPIRFEEALKIDVYALLFLDEYRPEMAKELLNFGESYLALKEEFPRIEVVLMPRDRDFYNFGNSVGFSVPMIATHMRIGYIDSLSFKKPEDPAFVIVDNNGRVLASSQKSVDFDRLGGELEDLLEKIGIDWDNPQRIRLNAYQRSASWNR